MPLSENEQKILSEIEAQLYRSDPGLAREVGSTTVYTHAFRNIKISLFTFVIGVAAMVMTLSTHFLLAFGGFVIMLASAIFFERNARRLGRAGMQQMTENLGGSALREYFAEPGQRFRRPGERPPRPTTDDDPDSQ